MMPNPREDIECKRCHDTGLMPGTERLCACVGGQRRQWGQHTEACHAKGLCEFSGLRVTACVRSICDCFETEEGAIAIERKARENGGK